MFSTVLFDLDGTLLDTLGDLAAAGNYALRALDLPEHPVNAYKYFVGGGIPNLISRILPKGQGAAFERAEGLFTEYYRAHMLKRTAPYPGIAEMLEALRARGVRTGILSNKADALTRSLAEHYFSGWIDEAQGLAPGCPPKPDPASLFALMRRLNARTEETLYCGDSAVDMRTAQAGGLVSCGVLWGFRDEAELTGAGARYIVRDARELCGLILSGGTLL